MKYILILCFTLVVGLSGCGHKEPLVKFKGDFTLQEGVQGGFGKSGTTTFHYKAASFKIPDEYSTGYDSIQIILDTKDDPIVTFCYQKAYLKYDTIWSLDTAWRRVHNNKFKP